jgi:hypothetical protein
MRAVASVKILVMSLLVISTGHAAAQSWCAYSQVREAELNCGYSSEKACEQATKPSQLVCMRNPFVG